jgi:hypothetical protein
MFRDEESKHYDIEKWVDFVRGVIPAGQHDTMQAHLEKGCLECGEVAGLLHRIAQRAKQDASYHVPEHAARNARALYSLQRPEEVKLLPRTLAKLVYDSFREPLLAGVRSQQSVAHQLMYTAGPYCIDLRLEKDRDSRTVRLVGQIANREYASDGVPAVPVFLLSRNLVVNKTATNEFGEFTMEYAPRTGLRLFAPIPGENHIEVRLGQASAAGKSS